MVLMGMSNEQQIWAFQMIQRWKGVIALWPGATVEHHLVWTNLDLEAGSADATGSS
jgi:hypothetical protein